MTERTAQLDGATNILLEEPPMSQERDFCSGLLFAGATEPNVLFVSYTRQAQTCVDQLAGEAVGQVGVVTVGDASERVEDDAVQTERIPTASDLTGLGIQMDEYLGSWDRPVHVCFDSLTSMLQYVEYRRAYEFLHAITGKVNAADARAHFHIDTSAHDEEVVAGIASLVDARVTLTADGYSVQRRKLLE